MADAAWQGSKNSGKAAERESGGGSGAGPGDARLAAEPSTGGLPAILDKLRVAAAAHDDEVAAAESGTASAANGRPESAG